MITRTNTATKAGTESKPGKEKGKGMAVRPWKHPIIVMAVMNGFRKELLDKILTRKNTPNLTPGVQNGLRMRIKSNDGRRAAGGCLPSFTE